MENKINSRKLVLIALFIALQIVFTRFLSVNTTYLRIGFNFLPLAACSILMGPGWGAVAAGIADVIGAVMFPAGPFFPGFTLSALLTGAAYGIFTYKRKPGLVNVIIPVAIDCLIINMLLGTLWLHMLYGKAYLLLLGPRIIKNVLAMPIQVTMVLFFWKFIVIPYQEGRFARGN